MRPRDERSIHAARSRAAVYAVVVMPSCNFMRGAALALAVAALPAAAGAQDAYRVLLAGAPLGGEQIAISRSADGWTISSSGQVGPPVDSVIRRLQIRYDADWKPLELVIDSTVRGQVFSMRVTVEGTSATTHVFNGGRSTDKTDMIAADSVLLPPGAYFAPFVAVAAHIRDATPGSSVRVYVPAQGSFDMLVGESTTEQFQTVNGLIVARRVPVKLAAAGAMVDAEIWIDSTGKLLRVIVPSQSVDVIRDDLASVSSRQVTISRPNDEQVKFGSNGVTLAGTVSKPSQPSSSKLPAVVLVSGSGPHDRDSVVSGIPIMGELADAIANAGYLVLRYDKRGFGQSGGRPDAVSLADFAEDLKAAVQYLADRKDVDPRRIAVVGHSEGGAVALLAAEKDKRIAAVALISTNGFTGTEIVLAQQQRALARSTLSDDEKQQRIELQKKIIDAVLTGKGLDQLPPAVRRQVDNAEFQSILANDPSKIVPKVKQPILIVQGDLDTQVEPLNADRLEQLTKTRKNGGAAEVVKVPGVNHLLVPAKTGEVDEYATLKGEHVSPAVTGAITSWLKKALTSR